MSSPGALQKSKSSPESAKKPARAHKPRSSITASAIPAYLQTKLAGQAPAIQPKPQAPSLQLVEEEEPLDELLPETAAAPSIQTQAATPPPDEDKDEALPVAAAPSLQRQPSLPEETEDEEAEVQASPQQGGVRSQPVPEEEDALAATTAPAIQRQVEATPEEEDETLRTKLESGFVQRQAGVTPEDEKEDLRLKLESGLVQRQEAMPPEEEEAPLAGEAVQAKLTVGAPDDHYERQADQVADQVLRMPAPVARTPDEPEDDLTCSTPPSVQRTTELSPENEEDIPPRTESPLASTVQRACSECAQEIEAKRDEGTERVQASADRKSVPRISSDVQRSIQTPGIGAPLSDDVRAQVEPTLGADLGDVRVHNDADANDAARSLRAKAFTHKNHIWLASGQSANDLGLMAHELTHAVQQDAAPVLSSAAPSDIQRDDDETDGTVATRQAEEVYEALDGWNDEPRALEALQGHGPGTRAAIRREFQDRFDQPLPGYLKDQLGGDWLVRAFALLTSSNYHEPHTSMALALIPVGTRDEEVFRILEGTPLDGRQPMERRYNETFDQIGEGSLKEDLKSDLSGWREEKSLALLHRTLTQADHLYFNSVAITGTHTDSVIRQIQSAWDGGPARFRLLEHDWDQYVRNEAGWTEETWTDMTLTQAMSSELSGESWELVHAVLEGYRRYKEDVGLFGRDLTEDQLRTAEDSALRVANETLEAATTGGLTGLGTNEAQVFRAVRQIREICHRRIQRAEDSGNERLAQTLRDAWERRRQELMAFIPSEMSEGSADYQRVRLLLAGSLTPADEVYLADQAYDNDRILALVTQYWAQGKMSELLSQSRESRTERDQNGRDVVIRPAYQVYLTIGANHGLIFRRMYALVRDDWSDTRRGVERLKLELDEGDSDSDLKKAYDLLTTAGIQTDLRSSVIEQFASSYLSDYEGETPAHKFIQYISQRYEDSHTTWEFRDLLLPTQNPEEMVRRAEGRLAASRSGLLDVALGDAVSDYDRLTGEDTQQLVQESLERLRFIARQHRANPQELAAMMAMTGTSSPEALASMEYGLFRKRLEEVRALKRAIADAIATIVEIAIEAVLTIATGGAAAGALVASLTAAVAGMLLREALLGQDYDLLSRQNAQQLFMIVAGQGIGHFGGTLFDDILDPRTLERLGRSGHFLKEAGQEGFKQVNVQILTAGLEGRMPTVESITVSVITTFGSATGAGAGGAIRQHLQENSSRIERLRVTVASKVAEELITGTSEEGASLVSGGMGDLTGVDVALRFGRRGAGGFARGVVSGSSEVLAQDVARRREQGREHEELPPEVLEELARAEEHRRATGDVDASESAALSGAEGPVAVAFMRGHTISVVRTSDGSVIVTICSLTCSNLSQRLADAKHQNVPGADEIENDLNAFIRTHGDNPADADARTELENLARRLDALVISQGEAALLGDVPTPSADLENERASQLLREAEADFRRRIDTAGSPEAADNVRYERYVYFALAEGRTPMPRDQWQEFTDRLRENSRRGREDEDEALNAAGVVNNNRAEVEGQRRDVLQYQSPEGVVTRPDGVTDSRWIDVKSLVEGTLFYTEQLRAQKQGALSGYPDNHPKDLAVVISNNNPDAVRPSGPLADNADVLHRHNESGEWSRWDATLNDGQGGWRPISNADATSVLGGSHPG